MKTFYLYLSRYATIQLKKTPQWPRLQNSRQRSFGTSTVFILSLKKKASFELPEKQNLKKNANKSWLILADQRHITRIQYWFFGIKSLANSQCEEVLLFDSRFFHRLSFTFTKMWTFLTKLSVSCLRYHNRRISYITSIGGYF